MATDQLTISIEGGGPYGFRLFGGEGQPLVVAKLRKRSKAWESGLEEGDVLVGINGSSCSSISHAAAMGLVEGAGLYLCLRVLRRGGGHLNTTRGGSRQRSITPSAGPSAPVRSNSSSGPPFPSSTSSVQRSSLVEGELPTGNQRNPGSFKTGTEVHLQLESVGGSGGETGGEENTWTTKSSVALSSERHRRIQEFSGGSLQEERSRPPPSPFRASLQTSYDPDPAPVVSRSPAVWKPPSWNPSSGSSRTTAPEDRPRSAHSVGYKDSKENIHPPFNGTTKPPAFQANSFPSAVVVEGHHTNPAVWQPSIPPLRNSSTNFPAIKSPQSPLTEINFLKEDGRGGKTRFSDRWQTTKIMEEENFSFDLSPNLNKILAPSKDEYDAFNRDKEKKKIFVDSSFYDDPAHRYPTVEEQIRMARSVAQSLTAPTNESARGQRMFMKRKEKSDNWVVDASRLIDQLVSDPDPDPYYTPTPWNAAPGWKAAPPMRSGAIPTPPSLPTSRLFAPKLYPGYDDDDGGVTGERSKALSSEEFERLRLFSQKTTHSTVSPQVCFNIAEDLNQSKGKGGKMFAKRRAKAEDWTVEGQAPSDPKMKQKISEHFAPGAIEAVHAGSVTTSVTGSGDLPPPVNRLKEMVELPKPKMTPWDAVADFGDVDLAFEHLHGISFVRPSKSNPYTDQVANSLQQATQKRSGFSTGPPPPHPPHPSPIPHSASAAPRAVQNYSQGGFPQVPQNRASDSFTAPDFNSWSQSQSTSNTTTIEFSPLTFKGSGTTGYRPITFQPTSGLNSSPGDRYTDL